MGTETDQDYDLPVNPILARNCDPVRELRSQPWFHGQIPRRLAEISVKCDGDFLVRDSISIPGEFVLTCHWNGPLHFQINKLILPADETLYGSGQKTLYQFEDEQFQSIVDLIDFYRTHRKWITDQSKCRLSNPVSHAAGKQIKPQKDEFIAEIESNYARINRRLPPIPAKGLPKLSIPPNPNFARRPLPKLPPEPAPLPRQLSLGQRVMLNQASKCLQRKFGSESKLFTQKQQDEQDYSTPLGSQHVCRSVLDLGPGQGPLKPRRAPSLKYGNGQRPMVIVRDKLNGQFREIVPEEESEVEGEDYCDIDYAEMDEDEGISDDKKDTVLQFRSPQLPQRRNSNCDRDSACVMAENMYDNPNPIARLAMPNQLSVSSQIRLNDWSSPLVPKDSKPLNDQTMAKILDLLSDSNAEDISKVITEQDWSFIASYKTDKNIPHFANCGLAMLLLPHGAQMRADLDERSRCLKLFVMVTIIKSQNLVENLSKWIQTARFLCDGGNFYSFGAVMEALTSSQITSLRCWSKLRSQHTEIAIIFENRLRPFYAKLSKTTPDSELPKLPYLQGILRLLDSDSEEKMQNLQCNYEQYFGMDIILYWLQLARKLPDLKVDSSPSENGLNVLFECEFQLNFLWGTRGATAPKHQRHCKFDQLLTLLAERVKL